MSRKALTHLRSPLIIHRCSGVRFEGPPYRSSAMNRHLRLGAWVAGSKWRNRLIVFGRLFVSRPWGRRGMRPDRLRCLFRHGSAEEEVAIRMRPRIMPVVVLTLVAVALLGGAAYGEESVTYSTPGECYTCHGVAGTGAVGKVDFQVEPVDYAKCATCHAAISTAQHWHNPGSFFSRCSTCHNTTLPIVTDSTYRFTSVFLSAEYGTFKTSASLASTPQTLHGAHSGAGWVNSLTFRATPTTRSPITSRLRSRSRPGPARSLPRPRA